MAVAKLKHAATLPWLVMILLSLVWGSSFVLIKQALVAFSALQVASLRLVIASLCMLPFFSRELRKISRGDWIWLVIVGLAGTGIPAFCYPLAETEISSITTGILNSLTPVFTLLLGVIFFRQKSGWWQIAGIAIGFAGAVLIIGQADSENDGNLWYALYAVAGALLYSLSGNTVNAKLRHLSSVSIAVVAFTLLGIPCLIYLFTTDFINICQTHPEVKSSLLSVSFLAVFGTAAASVLYFKLVQMTTAVFASLVAYIIPIVAIVLGVFVGEALSPFHLVGLILIAMGIWLTKRKG